MPRGKSRKKLPIRLFFYLLLFLLFLFSSFKIYKAFKNSRWQGKENFNLAIETDEGFYLLLLKPKVASSKVLVIPENTYLQVPPEYGLYPLKSIYSLGEQEFKNGGQLLSLTLGDFLGAPVKGWLKINQKIEPNRRSLLLLILKNILLGKGTSNLRTVDSLKVVLALGGLKRNSFDLINLGETTVLSEATRPDGEKFLKANSLLIDQLLLGFFEEEQVREESIRLAVFNASQFEELAKKVGRGLKNLGCEVVMVSNLPCDSPPCNRTNSELLYQDEKLLQSATFTTIEVLYPVAIKRGKIEGVKVDLVIVLGEDFWQRLRERK